MPKIALVSLIAVAFTLALGAQTPQTIPPPGSKAPVSGYTVVRSFPHDPKAYTRPWTVRVNQRLLVDTDLIEFVCLENEKFSSRFRK